MATQDEVHEFATFALQRIHDGDAELSMDELYDMWRHQNPDPAVHAENLAAVRAAIEDFKAGDRGQPAGPLTRELRDKLGMASEK